MTGKQIAVAFHGIGNPVRVLEPGEARYWIGEGTFLRFLDLVAAHGDPSRVRLSFDDGNESDFEIARPALQERGLTASFFVITSRLDGPGSLSSSQLRSLAEGMEIGSHGVDHVDWRDLTASQLESELAGSKQVLERCIGRAVTVASIPFGRYNARVLRALQRAGYATVYSSDGGPSLPVDRLVARTNVRADTTLQDFANLISGVDPIGARLVRRLKAIRRRFV
jgi:peptidoglycan/xylan/chitin deacetylase (PgdA/CDA1 family)